MAGIYLHIPFCKKMCGYCDFYKSLKTELCLPYITALHNETDRRAPFLTDRNIRTVYFGGGTPSLIKPALLQGIIDHIRRLFDTAELTEITLEANPDDLDEEYFEQLRKTEINRLSIGIQSFDDRELQFMNRRHTARQAIEAVERAQKYGFDNISIDLIYGLPCSDDSHWQQNLKTALTLGIQHISAYHLTIEERTHFGAMQRSGKLSPVAESTSERQYAMLHTTLTEAGFEHYEISNFALYGFRSRHNSSYWNNTPYLGLGPAAHSYNGTQRVWCAADVGAYIANDSPEKLYTCETLSDDQKYDEYVMTRLRTAEGVDLATLAERFGAYKLQYFTTAAQHFTASGDLIADGKSIRIPPEKFLISDSIICDLFADTK